MKHVICLASLLWIGASAFTYAKAENVSLEQQFEQAVYTEEVLGDLDKATQLYQSIISDGHKSRTLVANALLRLAQCQQKLGEHSAASETFLRIKRDYADIEQVIGSVKLFEAAQAEDKLSLKPVPWEDGETLEYAFYDANDNVSLYQTQIMTRVLNNKGAMQSKKEFITMSTASKNGHYHALILDDMSGDLVSYQMQSSYDKGVFFNTDNGKIFLSNKNNGAAIETQKEGDAIDELTLTEVLRRLPYKADFKERIKVYSLNTLSHSEMIAEVVNDNARISVPAGEFDTYHIRTEWLLEGKNINAQDIWIAKDDNSKIIQSTSEHHSLKLLRDSSMSINTTRNFKYKDQFQLTLPNRWSMFDMTLDGSNEMVLVPTPFEAHKLSAQITSKYESNIDWKKESLAIIAKWNIDFAKSYYKHFVVREDTRKNFTIAELPVYSYIADFKNGELDMIEYRIVVLKEPMVYQAFFHINNSSKGALEAIKPEIDALINSLIIIKP